MAVPPYEKDFHFDLARGLADQLDETFGEMSIGPFRPETVERVRRDRGVYLIYQGDRVVYVGKSDSLRDRLRQHYRKIKGRCNLDLAEMGFKCLYLDRNWAPIGTEEVLMKRYRESGEADWNGSSFGSKDPGKERDTTQQPPDRFDQLYPMDMDIPVPLDAGKHRASDVLKTMKEALPLFRYDSSSKAKKVFEETEIELPHSKMTADQVLRTLVDELPSAKGVVFYSHVILYLHDKKSYPSARYVYS